MRRARVALCLLLLVVSASARFARAADDDPRVGELERKVDVLTQEIESLRMGGAAAETTVHVSRVGLGPAASKVYAKDAGVSIGGYGEMQFRKTDRENENGVTVPGPRSALDFVRAVLYVGYKFSDDLLFNSEVEFEHGGVFDKGEVAVDPGTGEGEAELSGEAVLEFGYLEWLRNPAFGVRAGKLLVPLGLTNEQHEPPTYLGVQRPETERFVIPTTWSGMGAGVAGEMHGIAYRAYLLEGFDSGHLTAEEGLREGRQKGSSSLITHPAFAARADWTGTPGVLVGASLYTGRTWQGDQPAGGATLDPELRLWDVHARLEWRGVQARALYAFGTLSQTTELSAALGVAGTSDAIGDHTFGGYLEAGYDVLGALRPGSRWGLLPYLRYEEYDTQEGVVAPGSEDPAYAHRITTAGLALKPHPSVVIKADREWRDNEADTEVSRWNASVGYLF